MFISYIYNRGNNQIENLRQNENNRSNIRKDSHTHRRGVQA